MRADDRPARSAVIRATLAARVPLGDRPQRRMRWKPSGGTGGGKRRMNRVRGRRLDLDPCTVPGFGPRPVVAPAD